MYCNEIVFNLLVLDQQINLKWPLFVFYETYCILFVIVNNKVKLEMDIKKNYLGLFVVVFNRATQNIKRLNYDSAMILKVFILALLTFLAIDRFKQAELLENDSERYINSPKINDIYFLDFRLLSDSLRPKEKYRLAKVVDITGEVITLQYGNMFYLRQQSLKDSIRYGQLRYRKYFESKRYDFSHDQVKKLWQSGAIYLVKRPVLDRLFGNYVSPEKIHQNNDLFIPGKYENYSANSFFNSNYIENNLSQAFELFQQSAQLGFAEGQVNLAQMYLNGQSVEKNSKQALFWFKQAALQSYKPAILKYVIVCEQVSTCDLSTFYQSLIAAGVNIKVREMDVKLSPNLS